MKVKVSTNVQCVWDGKRYVQGDTTPDLPNEIAESWLREGWVVEAKAAAPRKKTG